MPAGITGQEGLLRSMLISSITAAIAVECGYTVMTPNCINGLAKGIADAIIPFLVTNTKVNSTTVPGAGLIDSISGPVTGTADTDPGSIS